ncbi:hypothetical protein [Streptosporangium canum]|uniref:hypothetical protein n=1 Tax=Streptosporangium canum TaxID=324952 RepID=UPI003417EC28
MVTSPDHQRHDDGRGMSHCREVVEETAGTRRGRSKPTATIERMTAGDTLVVYMPDTSYFATSSPRSHPIPPG